MEADDLGRVRVTRNHKDGGECKDSAEAAHKLHKIGGETRNESKFMGNQEQAGRTGRKDLSGGLQIARVLVADFLA